MTRGSCSLSNNTVCILIYPIDMPISCARLRTAEVGSFCARTLVLLVRSRLTVPHDTAFSV